MAPNPNVLNSAAGDSAMVRAGAATEPAGRLPVAPTVPRNPQLADWFPSAENVFGTNENRALLTDLDSNPEFQKEKQRIELSFSLDKKYQDDYLRYIEETKRVRAADRGGIGLLPNTPVPTRHPYSSWISTFGENSNEVVTNISSTQSRVQHIFDRVRDRGFFDKLKSDNNLRNEFEDIRLNPDKKPIIADWMLANGYLQSEEERDLFNRHVNSPYSKYWGISLHDKLEQAWNTSTETGEWRAWHLPTDILRGRKLNSKSSTDMDDWERFRAWRVSQPGHNWFMNFSMGMGHIIGSFGATLKNAARSTAYPEFEWADNWKVATGENAIRKQKFIDMFNAWIDDPERDGDAELEAYAHSQRQGAAPDTLKFPDPTAIKSPSEKTQEMLKLYRELNKEGAFNMDVRGISAALAGLDGAVQGTLAIGSLFYSTDPDSLFFKAGVMGQKTSGEHHFAKVNRLIERDKARVSLSDADYQKFVQNQKTDQQLHTAAEMDYFQKSVHAQNWFMNTAKEGLIFSGDWYDSSVGYNTSMWADLFIVAGVAAKGLKTLQGAKSQAYIVSKFGSAAGAVEKELNALRANVDFLRRKGVELSGDAKKAVDTAKGEMKTRLGREVTDIEALEAIMADEKVFKDPITGQMKSLGANEKSVIRQGIVDHANNVLEVKRRIAAAYKAGKAWTEVLSDTSKKTMTKVRQRLMEIEPDGGWDKVSDNVIYSRMRGGSIEKPGVKSAIDISAEEIKKLYSEVGSIWRGVNTTGKAGFRSADSLGVQVWDPAFYASFVGQATFFLAQKGSAGLGWLADKGVKWLTNHAVNPGDTQTILRTASTPSHELASTRLNVGSQTALERVSTLNRFIAFGRLVGDWESAAAAAKDYFSAMRLAPVDATSVSHGLKVKYQKRLDELNAIVENNRARGVKLTAAEEKALTLEIDMVTSKMKHMSRIDASSRYGLLNATNELFGYGGSMMIGEALMYANDTDSMGLGAGFTTGMRGGHIMSSAVMRNVHPTMAIKERANLDLYSLSERMQHMIPSQAAILLEAISRLAKRRDETYREPGMGIFRLSPESRADIEFSQGLSILDRIFTMHGDVVLSKGTGIIDGVALINSAGEYRNDPKLREALVSKLEAEGARIGLNSDESRAYAAQLMRAHEDGVLAEQRSALIDEEIAHLEGEKKKLADQVSGPLEKVKNALRVVFADAGLVPDNIRVNSDSKFYDGSKPDATRRADDPRVITYVVNGKEVPVNQIPGATPKLLERIDAIIAQYKDVQKEVLEGNGLIAQMNDKIRALNEEKTTLANVERTPGFSDRPVVMLGDGSYILQRKGLTIWESVSKAEDGTEVTRAKIYLDIESFLERARYVEEVDPKTGKKTRRMAEAGGYALALEEYSHALFFAESMRDTRIQMERDILGGWSYDENGIFVNKIPDERGQFIDAPARITGDYKTNLELIRKYAEAYAEGLPDFAKQEFLARFDYGVHRFEQNKTDTRHLQGVFLELYASMYVQRMMQQNPNVYKSKLGSSQSYSGGWNSAPITAGAGIGERWSKFLFGQQTLVDIMMEGRYDLTSIDPMSPEAAKAEALLNSTMNMVHYFGPGGIRETGTKSFIKNRLIQFGLMKRNNNSSDPLSAWSQTEMFSDGRWRDIPLEAQSWVDGGTRHTRNVGSRIIYDDPWNIQRVIDNENKTDDPNEARFRVTWAYATGRKHWLSERNDPVRVGAPGQQRQFNVFKDRIENLFYAENQVVRDFVGMVIKDDPNGDTFGLKVTKTKAGHNYGLVGMPNPEQAQRVFAWVKEQNRIRSEEDNIFMMNTQTMEIIKELLGSLSNSTHHPSASNPGFNRVYRGEYTPIRTGLGPGTTATTKAEAPREMTFSPVMLVIKDTSLTAEGKPILKRNDDEGKTSFLSRPMLYVLAMDHDARAASVAAAWQGRLSDVNGKRYVWNTAEMERLFGNFNTFAGKVEEVFRNLATGKYGITDGDLPESRTWELLLDFAGQDKQKALKMAAIIHRTIGPFENKFIEISKLEREALRTTSETRREKLKALIREKKSELDFEPDQRQQWLNSLLRSDAREIGGPRMADTRHPFMLIRPDRFIGTPMQMQIGKAGAIFPISGAAYGFAQIGYANQGPWARVPLDDLQNIRKQYQWGSTMLMDVWNHPSGYKVWKTNTRKGGKFQKATYQLIAPDGSVVERPIGSKTSKEFETQDAAFDYAGFHSKKNPQDNVPIVGNLVEEAMRAGGWNPRGTKFAINARSEFASTDNRFFVRRKDTGGWDLFHNESGIMLMKDVRIYSSEVDAQGRRVIDPKELNASVVLAEELGLVESAIDINFIRQYVPTTQPDGKPLNQQQITKNIEMFMEWRKDSPLIEGAGMLKRQRPFSKNPMYWEWKRALAKATSPSFAIEAANRMVQELGRDVVEGDLAGVKTQEWITKFTQRLDEEGFFAAWIDKRSFEQIKADEHAEASAERTAQFQKDVKKEKKGNKEIPKPQKPEKPIRDAYDTVESFNEAMLNWQDRVKQYDTDLRDYEDWHRGMSEREMALADDQTRAKAIQYYRELIQKDLTQVQTWRFAELGGIDMDKIANGQALANYQRNINAIRESANAVLRDTWLNETGYLITSMMYDEPKIGPGIKIQIGSPIPRSRPGGKPTISFYVFTQEGQLVGNYQDWEKARKAALLHHLGIGPLIDLSKEKSPERVKSTEKPDKPVAQIVREDIPRQDAEDKAYGRYLRSKIPPRSPSRVPPSR